MLSSWNADVMRKDVYLSAYYGDDFTRQSYADLLRKMGQIFERWFRRPSVPLAASGEVSEQHTKRGVFVCLRYWEVWVDWWWKHVQECFPTFAKSERLAMIYHPRVCSSSLFGGGCLI